MSAPMLRRSIAVTMAVLVIAAFPGTDAAFSYATEGEPLPSMTLPRVGGGAESYLGEDDAVARVFAFVKADHKRSTELLTILDDLHREFAERPVHWALIVSDRHGGSQADSLSASYPDLPILRDMQDGLYGALGVALTPVVGIADEAGVLSVYLPYHKINYSASIAAHVRFLLGDIDDDALAKALAPSGRVRDTADAGVLRTLKLARMLLDRGKFDQAQKQAEKALAAHPDQPDILELLADIELARNAPSEPEETGNP